MPLGDRLQNGEEKLQGHKIPIRPIVPLLACLSALLPQPSVSLFVRAGPDPLPSASVQCALQQLLRFPLNMAGANLEALIKNYG